MFENFVMNQINVEVVVVYWRIHYIYCHSIDLTVIYNNSGYRWDAGSINI